MKNYVLIPNYTNDIQTIHSNNLRGFFKTVKVEGNKFPLDSIRKLYVDDRDKFIKVTDELTLRGFQFFTEIPNNILPSFSCELSTFINVSSNKDLYKSLGFQHLGLAGFIHRFQIDSDLFFDQVPIECFQYINASIDVKELVNEFRLAGFTVTSLELVQDQAKINPVDTANLSVNTTNITDHVSNERNSGTYIIDDIFKENKYNWFRRYCHKNNVFALEDITMPFLNEFKNSKGVGIRKYEMVLEQLETYGFSYRIENNWDEEYIISPDNFYVSGITIKDLFYENKYKKFLEICTDVGIDKISEIKKKHIKTFSSLPGVGKKKIDSLKEKLQSISNELDSDENTLFSAGNLYPYLKNTQISDLLETFEIETDISTNMIISELEGKDLRELEQFNNLKIIYQLSYELQKLSSPEKVLKKAKSQLTKRDLVILNMRFLHGNTLEETGQHLGVTRERVRQLETKIVKKIVQLLQANRFQLVLSMVLNNKPFISYEELLDVIGEDNRDILELFKEKNVALYYAEELDAFFLDEEKKANFITKLEDIMEELPETFNLKEYENVLEDILKTDHDLNLKAILEYYGYNQFGTLYSLNRLTITNVIELIFQYYIYEPIKLDESSVDIIRELAERHFDYQLGDSIRYIESRLRESENIILVDKNTFQWFKPETINQSLVDEIKDYIMNQFETREVINIEEVYQTFEDRLTANQIHNKLHLYSLIKYFFDEDFSIGKGNTLNIYRESDNKLNIEDRLITAIRSLGRTCAKDQLEMVLKWPRYKIDLAISSSDQIVTWEKNTVKLFDSLLTNDEKEELIRVVEANMKNGYTTSSLIYEQMMFNKKLAPLIQKKNINSSVKISSIVKNMMPSVKGHHNFLYTEGSKFTTFEDVIVDHFKDETPRSAIQSFILQHGYKDLMVSNFLDRIVENNYFIEIDLGVYYPSDKFSISEETVQTLIQFIEVKMGNQQYISLNTVEGYRSALPAIDFRWNPFLLKSILVKNGYRQIEKIHNDYRYDMIILVPESSTIKSFDELTYSILKDRYNGNMHETAVYHFLADKGLLRKKDYGKTLPYEIRSKSNLIQVDEIGIVKLK
ncbi:sigma factor-like helix-turn-helix DNA-binding protein [Virgibacillus ndiopensis]|uniref:sigma factor-like helix-turn-helix DNA-binding protein n=1 Tax=Virgibacillus ndiopensis TaxID=2004408 RepID=UPI000C06CB83|nr:sigma factor-like helix-turn-helix DNA-binding protein [Virgibacillus ndiopensis]